MNQLTEILTKIHNGGGLVFVQDGRVRLRVPTGLLDQTDRSILAQHRQELVFQFTPVDTVDIDKTPQNPGKGEVLSTGPDRGGVAETAEFDQDAIAERSAIEWVEAADPADLAAALTEAVETFDLIVQLDRLGIDGWLKAYTVAPLDCPTCGGGLDVWEDLRGGLHCAVCDPPIVAQRLRQHAERIRRRDRTRTKTAAKRNV